MGPSKLDFCVIRDALHISLELARSVIYVLMFDYVDDHVDP